MTICDMPSAFLDLEASYLRAYWLERSSFFKTLRERLWLTIANIFGLRNNFPGKLLAKTEDTEKFQGKKSNRISLASASFAYDGCQC